MRGGQSHFLCRQGKRSPSIAGLSTNLKVIARRATGASCFCVTPTPMQLKSIMTASRGSDDYFEGRPRSPRLISSSRICPCFDPVDEERKIWMDSNDPTIALGGKNKLLELAKHRTPRALIRFSLKRMLP